MGLGSGYYFSSYLLMIPAIQTKLSGQEANGVETILLLTMTTVSKRIVEVIYRRIHHLHLLYAKELLQHIREENKLSRKHETSVKFKHPDVSDVHPNLTLRLAMTFRVDQASLVYQLGQML